MAFDIREEDDDLQNEFDEYEDVKQPNRPKFYRRRKFWICCIPTTIITIIIAVVLALYVIMPKIAQGLMNKSTINFTQIVSTLLERSFFTLSFRAFLSLYVVPTLAFEKSKNGEMKTKTLVQLLTKIPLPMYTIFAATSPLLSPFSNLHSMPAPLNLPSRPLNHLFQIIRLTDPYPCPFPLTPCPLLSTPPLSPCLL
jgi:hypothetical protein